VAASAKAAINGIIIGGKRIWRRNVAYLAYGGLPYVSSYQ